MSRVQLALNVSDLDEAITFYSKLFATEPAKVRPGYANFAIAEPPLKLVLIEGNGDARLAEPPRRRGRSDRRGRGNPGPPDGRRPRHRHRGRAWRAATRCRTRSGSTAPTRRPWEIYTVLADVEMAPGELRTVATPEPTDALCCAERARVGRALLLTHDPHACDRARVEPRAPRDGRGGRHRAAGRRRRRLRHRRAAPLARRRRAPAARELDRDRRGARRADPRARPGVGRALQPGRHAGRPRARRHRHRATRGVYVAAQVAGACVGAMVANLMFELPAVTVSTHTTGRRARSGSARSSRPSGCCSSSSASCGPGRTPGGRVRGRRLHRGGVLVHVVDQLRQPRGHDRPIAHRHVRRHRARAACPAFVVAQIVGALLAVVAGAVPSARACPRPISSCPTTEGRDHAMPEHDHDAPPTVLFLCVHNAGRSQMALGWFRAPGRRSGGGMVGRFRAGRRGESGGDRGDGRGRASTSPASSRSRGPTRSCRPPTSSSRWAAVTRARSSRASATKTGSSTIRPARASRRSGRSATPSPGASGTSSPVSGCPHVVARPRSARRVSLGLCRRPRRPAPEAERKSRRRRQHGETCTTDVEANSPAAPPRVRILAEQFGDPDATFRRTLRAPARLGAARSRYSSQRHDVTRPLRLPSPEWQRSVRASWPGLGGDGTRSLQRNGRGRKTFAGACATLHNPAMSEEYS